jgi:hypothetical protein
MPNLERRRRLQREWKRKFRAQRGAAGLCIDCLLKAVPGNQRCKKHIKKRRASARKRWRSMTPKERKGDPLKHQKWDKTNRQTVIDKVLLAYGNRCACPGCFEVNPKFLTLDHINGGGLKDRREIGSSIQIYRWVIKNNFPSTFQLLCWNCNCGRSRNGGVCPHVEVSMEGVRAHPKPV